MSPFPCVGACLVPPSPAGNCLSCIRLFNTPANAQFALLYFLLDVKPSNVLINKEGHVKMCDFGISGYLVDSVAKTMDAGCKPYMAVSATLCSPVLLRGCCLEISLFHLHPEIKATRECSGLPDSAEPPRVGSHSL